MFLPLGFLSSMVQLSGGAIRELAGGGGGALPTAVDI